MLKKFVVIGLGLLMLLTLGCAEGESTTDMLKRGLFEGDVKATAAPRKAAAPLASGEKPDAPRAADTSAAAAPAASVATPLAVLASFTPEPSATNTPVPTATAITSLSAKENREEYTTRCKHWALRNMAPIEFSRFEQLDPYSMTDLERVLWGSVLIGQERSLKVGRYMGNYDEFAADHLEWCQDYWSEALDESNASKRNHELFQSSCLLTLVEEGRNHEDRAERNYSEFEELGMSSVIVNQAIRLLNWMDIDGDALLMLEEMPFELVDRVWDRESSLEGRYEQQNKINEWPKDSVLRSEKEWWGIEGVWKHGGSGLCKSYYPQLFFGRWVPLDDFGMDERLDEAQDKLREARESDDWPDWAEGPDRDILIRLGK